MPRGLGIAQRRMLFTLAQIEVGAAEDAAEQQQPYRSPRRLSLQDLAWATFLPDRQSRPGGRNHFSGRQWLYGHSAVGRELVRFNPSRAILGLEARGFVVRDRSIRLQNLALTREGFAEARRLGAVPDSEIVDLDRVAANWQDDVWLGPDLTRSEGLLRAIGGLQPIDRRKAAGKKSAENRAVMREWLKQQAETG
jgi:hypothetical protein